MENNKTERTIKISELWDVFISHIWLLILVGVLLFALVFAYQITTYEREYTSTATVYILKNNNESSASTIVSPTSSDFSLALNLVNDCTRTLKSRTILETVINNVSGELKGNVTLSYATLKSMVTINNPNSTRFLEISVVSSDPYNSMVIANELCEVGKVGMKNIMGIDQVNIVDKAIINSVPSNSVISILPFVIAIIGMVIIYIIYLCAYIFDDKISGPDDIEKYIGVPVLAMIPNAHDNGGNGKYGYGYRYKSNKYYASSKYSGSDRKAGTHR